MATVQINTAQNVTLNYDVASVGARMLAGLLDVIFMYAYVLLIFYFLDATDLLVDIEEWQFIILILPYLFYHFILELMFNGQSFGKMITKIKVIKADGSQAGIGSYFLRWLFGLFEIHMSGGTAAAIAILFNGKGQRLGDMAAGTRVISLKPKTSLTKDTILAPVTDDYQPQFVQVKKLSDKDVEIIAKAYKKAISDKNYKLVNQLADKIKATTGIQTEMPNIQFVETVLKDYSKLKFN
tara:strand:- start:71089 stop:71805 length:717 start_codon:yes stop_codon:yes gene_type:complete